MEFWALIDALDDLVGSAKHGPLRSGVRIEKQAALEIIGELRGAIPDELREAYRIKRDRAVMLTEAKHEVARIREEALAERARLLSSDDISAAAERRARELLAQAAEGEQEICVAAEEDALELLDALEAHLEKLAAAVSRGRSRLPERNPDQLIERDPGRLVARSGEEHARDLAASVSP